MVQGADGSERNPRSTMAVGRSSLDDDADINDSFLAGLAAAPSIETELRTPLLPGAHVVGKYRIEARVGQGGMGTVYRALDTRLQRTVAIKIHHSLTTSVERLRREARMLARLSHPNVVTVLEVGTHEGMVFVAMEYVDGGNARTWLRQQARTWQEIVELYRQAGRGLAAAHALGIVHRDFKPDNVLVGVETEGAQRYRARVADFGLAGRAHDAMRTGEATLEPGESRSLGDDEPGSAFATEAGAMVGTPAYVAPEQIGSSRVDARADQFAFCAALFEALYDELPFPGETAHQILARIASGSMVRPRASPRRPAWLLEVLERGMAHAPDDRYASMDALLLALAPARSTRRWWPFAVAGLGVAALGGMLSSREPTVQGCDGERPELGWQLRRGELGRAVEAGADPGMQEAWALVDHRLGDRIDAWSSTYQATCVDDGDARLRERRLECLADTTTAIDALLGELTGASEAAFVGAPELAERLPDATRCIATPVSAIEPPPEAIAVEISGARSEVAVATARMRLGNVVAADALAEVVVARAQQLGYVPLMAEALLLRARTRMGLGRIEDAGADAEAAYAEASRSGYDRVMARAADLRGAVAFQELRVDEALQWTDLARGHLTRPREDTDLFVMLIAREADIRSYTGELDVANALLDQAEAFIDELELPDDVRAIVQAARANLAEDRGDFGAALDQLERARDGIARTLGSSHAGVARSWRAIGRLYFFAGNYIEARNAYTRSAEIYERGGELSPFIEIEIELGLAVADDMLGDGEIALRRFDHVDALATSAGVLDDALRYRLADGRGVVLLGLGRSEAALPELARALELAERIFGEEHLSLRTLLANLALASRAAGRFEDAEPFLLRALQIESTHAQADLESAAMRHAYGFLLVDLGRLDEAAPQFERAGELIEQLDSTDSAEMGWVELGRGRIALARKNPELAVTSLERADALWADGGVSPEDRADLRRWLATARWQTGDRAQALAIAREAAAEVPGDAGLREFLATHHR